IPQDLVRSTITSYANPQIKVITQRIMTLSNLMTLVEKYELLDEIELKRTPRTEIMEKFQRDMRLDVLSAEVMDPRIGRPMEATIAFTLSFDHRSPGVAQKVANELVNLYLNENLKTRTEKTATTSQFLKSEAEAILGRISGIEQQLAEFKQRNEGALPELYQYNLNVIERTDMELRDSRNRLAELEKRSLELQANMARISPYAPTELPTGERVLSDHDRLKALESEFRAKSSLYSEQHPDLQRLAREIASLRAVLGDHVDPEGDARRLKTEREKLAQLRQSYSPDHPAVIRQQRVIEALPAAGAIDPRQSEIRADNPAYVFLDTQLKSVDADRNLLVQRIAELETKIQRFETYLSKAPDVEKRYAELTRELLTNTAKYHEITAKQMQAELAKNLETERKGERFNLIQPPIHPEKPASPNRVAIVLIGLLLAVGIGAASVAVAEMTDEGVRGETELTSLLGYAPLATIPYLAAPGENASRGQRLYVALALLVGGVSLLLLFIHFAVKPLDVLWFIAARRLGIG
ncbi:MAG: hypothetical protein RBS88_13365, partial [Spongiibacteraceae bacterium]|nr:hypothetical protein [Spongiibacteraceae bacterium]